jgi:hypothetical protein
MQLQKLLKELLKELPLLHQTKQLMLLVLWQKLIQNLLAISLAEWLRVTQVKLQILQRQWPLLTQMLLVKLPVVLLNLLLLLQEMLQVLWLKPTLKLL